MSSLLKAEHLIKRYGKKDAALTAVNDISLDIEEGEFTVILGRSGSGKSTLLQMMAGLLVPSAGKILFDGKSLYKMSDQKRSRFRRRNMGFIFQFFNLLPDENVYENIVLPMHLDGRKEKEAYVEAVLADLGIADKKYAWVSELSGGQQQRVSIARAIVSRPRIIFADEPTGNLDSESAKEVLRLFLTAKKKYNRTLVMVTHDLSIAKLADRVIVLKDGKIESDTKESGIH